jgi:hypothetical protein
VHYTESRFYQSKLQKRNREYSLKLTNGQLWDYGREVWDKMREEEKIRFFENEKKDKERYERELLIYNRDKAISEKEIQ